MRSLENTRHTSIVARVGSSHKDEPHKKLSLRLREKRKKFGRGYVPRTELAARHDGGTSHSSADHCISDGWACSTAHRFGG